MTSVDAPSLDFEHELVVRQVDGARIVLVATHVPSNIVHVQVDVGVGDDYETSKETREASHFIEHLIASGLLSKTYAGGRAKSIAEAMGIESNASTSPTRTSYFMTGTAEHLKHMIDMQVGAFSQFLEYLDAQPHYEEEARAVERELRAHLNDPSFQMYETITSILSPGHPRSVSQAFDARNVLSIARTTLAAYFRRHYVGSNIVVAVASHRPRDEVLALLEPYPFERGMAPQRPPLARASPIDELVVFHAESGTASIMFVWPVAYAAHDLEALKLTALSFVLTNGFSSRLLHRLRVQEGLVYSVSAGADLDDVSGSFSTYRITTSCDVRQVRRVLDAIHEELARLAADGMSDEEVTAFHNFVEFEREKAAINFDPVAPTDFYAQTLMFTDEVGSRDVHFDRLAAATSDDVRETAALLGRPPLVFIVGDEQVVRNKLAQARDRTTTAVSGVRYEDLGTDEIVDAIAAADVLLQEHARLEPSGLIRLDDDAADVMRASDDADVRRFIATFESENAVRLALGLAAGAGVAPFAEAYYYSNVRGTDASLLVLPAQTNGVQSTLHMLDRGAIAYADDNRALREAAEHDSVDVFAALMRARRLSNAPHVINVSAESPTILLSAARAGHTGIVRVLVRAAARGNPAATAVSPQTVARAFIVAAAANNVGVVDELVRARERRVPLARLVDAGANDSHALDVAVRANAGAVVTLLCNYQMQGYRATERMSLAGHEAALEVARDARHYAALMPLYEFALYGLDALRGFTPETLVAGVPPPSGSAQ